MNIDEYHIRYYNSDKYGMKRGANIRVEKAELKRVNVRIRPQLHRALKVAAKQRGLSMNAMFVLALETYLLQMKVIDNLDDLVEAWKEQE